MKYITRTINATKVNPSKIVVKNGKFATEDLEPFTLDGKVDETTILKACRKQYGKLNQYVFTTEAIENCYRMSVEDFIANAELIENADNVDDE